MLRAVTNLFWRVVFFWKKWRAGWLDMGQVITVRGVVARVDRPGLDGDGNFDLIVDPEFSWTTTLGQRQTFCPPMRVPALHCEVEPWAPPGLVATFGSLLVGYRVEVTGRWGFDGVHTGHSEPVEVALAIIGHAPNMRAGWFECHPVTSITVIK